MSSHLSELEKCHWPPKPSWKELWRPPALLRVRGRSQRARWSPACPSAGHCGSHPRDASETHLTELEHVKCKSQPQVTLATSQTLRRPTWPVPPWGGQVPGIPSHQAGGAEPTRPPAHSRSSMRTQRAAPSCAALLGAPPDLGSWHERMGGVVREGFLEEGACQAVGDRER